MPEFTEGQRAICHDCGGQIQFVNGRWGHVGLPNGLQPRHPPIPYNRTKKLEETVRSLISEAEFVISGGDDPHDRCQECGCAGYGMLRDAIADAKKVLEVAP